MNNTPTQTDWNYWYDMVYGYFYRRLNSRSEVDELTSETVTDFLLKNEEIQNPKALIFSIAKNKMKQFLYRKQRNAYTDFDQMSYAQFNPQTDVYSNHYYHKIEQLKACIQRQLNTQDQEIVELCVQSDFSSKQASQMLQITSTNIRQRLSRALKKLREQCKNIWLNAS